MNGTAALNLRLESLELGSSVSRCVVLFVGRWRSEWCSFGKSLLDDERFMQFLLLRGSIVGFKHCNKTINN
jgi:hypothetical protein